MRCKVIVTCFATRETRVRAAYPYHRQKLESPDACLRMLRNIVAAETDDCQLIIVNNRTGFQAGDAYLDSLPCIVEHRDNTGGPIAALDYVFHKYRDRFEYWLFTEDDIVITEKYNKLQERFDSEGPDFGFLAMVGFFDREPQHAHGAVGLTHRRILDRICDANEGHLSYPNSMWNRREMELQGEVAFSQSILGLGFNILPYGDNVCWSRKNGCLPYIDWCEQR